MPSVLQSSSLLDPTTQMNADVEPVEPAFPTEIDDEDAQDQFGRIMRLHRICQSQDKTKLIQLLEQGGYDINATGNNGETALHVALYAKSPEVAKVLINEGANPNVTDDGGTTPLQIALDRGFGTIAYLLLQNGAETDHLRLDTISLDLLDHSRMESKAVVLCLSREFTNTIHRYGTDTDTDTDTDSETDTDSDNHVSRTRRKKIRSTKRPTLLSLRNSIRGAGLEDLTIKSIFLPL